jgi:hypothetical protein
MKRVHLVYNEFYPILACSDLSDAYEMLLSFYEERTYEDFLWTKNEANDVLEFLLNYENYVEIYFIGNDENLSNCNEDEREIFAKVNRVYAELRKFFCYTDYKTVLVCCDW